LGNSETKFQFLFILLTRIVKDKNVGDKLRNLREKSEMPLRKVAALLDIDVAILSKMERGERRLTKEIVLKLAKIYKYDKDELLVLFLSDKIVYELQDEELSMDALKVAEEKIKYYRKSNGIS
jgi:HTH-type transcriptional regulator, competence development regulator